MPRAIERGRGRGAGSAPSYGPDENCCIMTLGHTRPDRRGWLRTHGAGTGGADGFTGANLSDADFTQAGSGEELPEAFTRNALLFIINAHAATVNMRLYPPTSSMVTETFDKAREAIEVSFEYADVMNVATIENSLMINNVRLPDVEQQKAPVKSFVAWMNEHGLSTIEFRQGLTGDELQTFFSVLSETGESQDRSRLSDELKGQGVEHVTVNQRVYVAVTTSDTGEIIGGIQGAAAPLDALKDELLMRYLMGKVDLGTVEDRELVDVLSDAGKVGGLLSRFLGEEGSEGGVYMKSQKAEEALGALSQMVEEIDDGDLRRSMGDQITRVVAEMSPREMTSVLSGRAPENLNIRHVRENVITMLSDNQLLDMIDSLIDEYTEMKDESGELEMEWTRQRLKDLNELLSDVRGERGGEIGETIDRKLDDAGIQEERDPRTGTRVLSAYQMLGGPLEEEDIDLGEGLDKTVPRQIRQLYAMDESDLAAGMLLKLAESMSQDSDAVRRYAGALIKETVEGLDEEHALTALEVIGPRVLEGLKRERDYQSFVLEIDMAVKMAEVFMKDGRAEAAVQAIEAVTGEGAEGSDKGDELLKYAASASAGLMGPEGVVDAEAILLEDDPEKRRLTVQALAALGPAALSPLLNVVKDRGQVELRDRALEAIRSAGETGVAALLEELEKENPWYVYRNVLNVVADLRIEAGLPLVVELANNPDERIRREAVRTLARIGSADSLETVLNAAGDNSAAVRRTAVRVLGMFGDKSVAGYLVDIINGQGLRGKEEDQGVVEAACLALGDLKETEYVPHLTELLGKGGLFKRSRPDEIRAAACIALGNLGDDSVAGVLEKASRDPSVMVRGSAEKGLRRLRGKRRAPETASPDDAMEPASQPDAAGSFAPETQTGAPQPPEPLFPQEQPVQVPPEPTVQYAPEQPSGLAAPTPEPITEAAPAEPDRAWAGEEELQAPVERAPLHTEPTYPGAEAPHGPAPSDMYVAADESVVEEIDWDQPVAGAQVEPPPPAPPDPSTLEYILSEQGDPGPRETAIPGEAQDGPQGKTGADVSPLEVLLLGEASPAASEEASAGSPALGGAPGLGGVEGIAPDDEERGPARLTLQPLTEDETSGREDAPDARVPSGLADLWPEGPPGEHDYPGPPGGAPTTEAAPPSEPPEPLLPPEPPAAPPPSGWK